MEDITIVEVANTRAERLRARVLIPFSIILVVTLLASLGCIYWLEWRQLESVVDNKLDGTSAMFEHKMSCAASYQFKLIENLGSDEKVVRALARRDRDALERASGPVFQRLHQHHGISHLYFIADDRTCVWRAHEPGAHGDTLQQATVDRAIATGVPVHGLELDPAGDLILYAVVPWREGAEIIGYVQFGQKVGGLTPEFSRAMRAEVFVAVNKQFLDRERWEERLASLGRQADWDLFPDVTLVDHSAAEISADMMEPLVHLHHGDQKRPFGIRADVQIFRGGCVPLTDAAGRDIGEIIVLADVTDQESYSLNLAGLLTLVFLAGGGLLFWVFFKYLGRVDRQLSGSMDHLREQVSIRQRTADRLRITQFAMDSSPDVAFWVNERGQFIYANKTACGRLGYSCDEMLKMNLWDVDGSLKQEDWRIYWHRFKQLKSEGGQTNLRTKTGEAIACDVSARLMDYGGQAFLCASARDISDRQQAEKQKKLLEQQLQRAEKMESLGVLAGGVAHDLNNMMGPLVAYPDMIMLHLAEDNPARKMVERMGRAARGAAEVIQDLLSLARRGRYELEPTDLNSVVRDYLDSASFGELSKEYPEIVVETRLDPGISRIAGSASHLEKVIMNLVVNAFDAMATGGTLQIQTYFANLSELMGGFDKIGAGDYVVLSVADTGIGIPREDLGRIFDPYFSRKSMGKSGTGLGLAVVYGIVKDHGGYYDVFSEPGKGTQFLLYFPVTNVPVPVSQRQISSWDQGGRILVADDSAEQRELTREILSGLGYEVEIVANGEEAAMRALDEDFDVMVLDMIMAGSLDGLDAYREVLRRKPGQKAVIVSGYAATERVREMQSLGAGAYVRKPFTIEAIGNAVGAEMRKKAVSSPAAT